jgi:hypothetical protein
LAVELFRQYYIRLDAKDVGNEFVQPVAVNFQIFDWHGRNANHIQASAAHEGALNDRSADGARTRSRSFG